MKVISIQVGKPQTVTYKGKPVTTAIFKSQVQGPILLRRLNLDGDGQADLRLHGGPDKALYAYSSDAYPRWLQARPQDSFESGAMGENLSFDALDETAVYVGDSYRLGQAVVQVAQPRFPCYKLAVKFDDPRILKQFMKIGRPGVYFRVIQEGHVNRGDELQLIDREKTLLSIAEFFGLPQSPAVAPTRIREILGIDPLPESWKDEFRSWIEP